MSEQHPTYYIHTFGCQMNHSDSERFVSVVENIGYHPTTDWQQADLIIFNTCSVRQKAEDRVLGMGKQLAKLKQQNPDLRVVLTGCMARRTWQGVAQTGSPIQMAGGERELQLQASMPWVDIVIETKDFGQLPSRLGIKVTQINDQPDRYLSFQPSYQNEYQAFVPISTGCDHFCTYCIVPFSRGKEVCRTAESVIGEVFKLVRKGYRDITLLGQTVNRWINPDFDAEIKQGKIANTRIPILNTRPLSDGALQVWRDFFSSASPDQFERQLLATDLDMPIDFLQLIQVIDQIPGQWWTTWISSHPNYMTKELIKFIGDSVAQGLDSDFGFGHQRPNIHFALQSGSDRILKRMNRRYDRDEFMERVELMRKYIPYISMTTDIIVGFPTETNEDIESTAELMRAAQFDMGFIAEFSPRAGTAAALIPDDVPHDQKESRKYYLNDDVLAHTSRANNERFIGTQQLALITGRQGSRYWQGRLHNNKNIRIEYDSKPNVKVGDFVTAKVTSVTNWALAGELVSE